MRVRLVGWLLVIGFVAMHPAVLCAQTNASKGAPKTQPAQQQRPADPRGQQQQTLSQSKQPAAQQQPPAQRPADTNVRPAQAVGPVQGGADRNVQPARAMNDASAPRVVGPQAPFALTPKDEQSLDAILMKWEKESDKVKTFKCVFDREEYDLTWGNAKKGGQRTYANGMIYFKAPDWGDYEVTKLDEWDAGKSAMVTQTTGLDHWRCDGESIFEYDHKNKLLIQRTLPKEMRGKAIADGPLPFVFGAKAKQLKERYWMKDVTPPGAAGKQVWLEAWPRRQSDAANFHHATVILTDKTFTPEALQVYMPDGRNHTDYMFTKQKTNDPFNVASLLPITVPFGWKRVVDPELQAAPPVNPAQAERQQPPAQRK